MTQALVVIDVLQGIFDLGEDLFRPESFLSNVEVLLSRARAAGTTIVHVQHLGRPGSPFAPGAAGRRFHERARPNPEQIAAHHNFVLSRFARVEPQGAITLRGARGQAAGPSMT